MDIQERLAQIVQKGLEQGFRPDYIREVLQQKGHSEKDITAAFSYKGPVEPKITPSSGAYVGKVESTQVHQRSSSSVAPTRHLPLYVYGLGALCVFLTIALAFSLAKPPTIIEVEKIVKIPALQEVAPQDNEKAEIVGSLRERLDSYEELSRKLDEKQKKLDEQLKMVTGFSVSMEDKNRIIDEQTKELQELQELRKAEHKQIVALLMDILNYILGRTQRVSG